MSLKFAFRELVLAAGARKRVDEVASFFMLVSNTGDKKIKISIDDSALSDCPIGYEYTERKDDEFFKHIDFKNPNVVEVTIEYIMSTGLVRSSPTILALDDILAELQGDITPETWGAPILVGLVPTQLLVANPNRKSLLIQLEIAAEGESVFLGFDDTVATNKYFRMLTVLGLAGYYDCVCRMSDYRGPIWAVASMVDFPLVASEW